MKAIDIFTRCRTADAEMRRLRQRIQQRRDALTSITPKMDTTGGGHSTDITDKTATMLADIDELERRLAQREQARRVEVAAACVLLDDLPETESAVIHGYYVQRQKVGGIASRLGYTDGYIRKVKAEAEARLKDVDEKRVAAALPTWYIKENGGSAE